MSPELLLRRTRWMVGIVILGLVLSGISAIPLVWQLEVAQRLVGTGGNAVADWVATLLAGLRATEAQAPFVFYGTDWLAFAHIVLAVLYVGAWRDPVRNIWLFQFGPIRGIPGWHVAVDCSFGVFCAGPFWMALKWTRALEGKRVAS